MEPPDEVAALLVGMLGDRTTVHHAYIGIPARRGARETAILELPGDGGTLREIELAAQGMETDFFQITNYELRVGQNYKNMLLSAGVWLRIFLFWILRFCIVAEK
jgi:hypothetical protein